MATITLPDGRSVTLRPQYLSEKNAIIALNDRLTADNGKLIDLLNGYADIIRPAVEATSWGGDVTEMPEQRLLWLLAEWARVTEEEAVGPPAGGTTPVTASRRRGSTRNR